MTQLGRRLIRKCQEWAEPLEGEAKCQKVMGNQGENHDIHHIRCRPSHLRRRLPSNAQQLIFHVQLGCDPIPTLPLTRQAPSVLDAAKQATLDVTANRESCMQQWHAWPRTKRASLKGTTSRKKTRRKPLWSLELSRTMLNSMGTNTSTP